MNFEQASFCANALNALFSPGDSYIVVDCFITSPRRPPEIMVNTFEKATAYEHEGGVGYFHWNDSYGVWSALYDLKFSIDVDRRQINMLGKTGAGDTLWRCVRAIEQGNWQRWRNLMQVSWKMGDLE